MRVAKFIVFLLLISNYCYSQAHSSVDTVDGISFRIERYADTKLKSVLFKVGHDDVSTNLEFKRTTFTGISNFQNLKKGYKSKFELQRCLIDTAYVFGSTFLLLDRDTISMIAVSGGANSSVHFANSKIKRMIVFLDTLESFQSFDSSGVNRLTISGTFVNSFAMNNLPDTLDFFGITVREPLRLRDNFSPGRIHYISLTRSDIDKLDWEYQDFKLYFPSPATYDYKVGIYSSVMEHFKRNGYTISYENLDKEFQEFIYLGSGNWFGGFLNWVDKNWWDYGYNKFLVVRNAIYLNILFFLINLFVFHSLVNHGYNIQKFVRVNADINDKYPNRFRRTLVKSPYIFLYTSFIFWGLSLKIDNLGIHRIGLFSYVLLQYIVGVVCLAYIANLIITV